jgi:hypothetical protein
MTLPDTSPSVGHYVIRAGIEERERLRVIARVMHSAFTSLFDRLALRELYAMADDPAMLAGAPRIVQTWGRRPR